MQRPYGEALPHGPTILCLVTAQEDLDRQAATKGDVIIDDGYVKIENGIDVDIQSLNRRKLVLSKASEALRGIVVLMNAYPQLGTKAVSVLLKDDEDYLARIQISRARGNGITATNANATSQNSFPWNLKAYVLFPLHIQDPPLIPSAASTRKTTISLIPRSLYPSKVNPLTATHCRRTT